MAGERKTKVLMLDDEKFLLEIYKTAFQNRGYEVTVYRDVDSALNALRKGENPDVILFDITMPESKSGYEFLKAVKYEGLGKNSLTVALTNAEEDKAKAKIKAMGADEYLLKSKYVPSEVVTAVAKILVTKKS